MRGFVAALALCVAAPASLAMVAAPYTGKGPAGTYVEAVVPVPAPRLVKDEARIDPGPLVPFIPRPRPKAEPVKPKRAAGLQTETIRLPRPCSDVRKVVDEVGSELAEVVAKQQGWTMKQIAEARKCFKEKK